MISRNPGTAMAQELLAHVCLSKSLREHMRNASMAWVPDTTAAMKATRVSGSGLKP